jgi:hypothetical protein
MADEETNVGANAATEADLTVNLDGSFTLEETQNACQVEHDAGFELRAIKFGTVTAEEKVLLVNIAEFMNKPIGRLRHILFVPVGLNDPEKLKKQKVEAEGWTFISDSQIYVAENITRVMAFGRRKLP